MGRLIDADELIDATRYYLCDITNHLIGVETVRALIFDAPTVEAIPKADYENRLKADLKAILVELQLEIEETAKDAHTNAFMNGYKDMYLNGISASAIKCSEIIQQKINSLKEAKDGENNN